MKQAAGILLFQKTSEGLKVLIVHPSGSYNKKAPWSIPKGEIDSGEHPMETAVRETAEEVGIEVPEDKLVYIGSATYKSRSKEILCYIAEVDPGTPAEVTSWEIDQAEWVLPGEALKRLKEEQRVFVTSLQEVLSP
jgi:predicted NUDIX family NTP pyrophosphohydrolase